MGKTHGLTLDSSGTFTFLNPLKGTVGENDKFKSTGTFSKKGLLGLGGIKMDDNAINNLAFGMLEKVARSGNKGRSVQDILNSDYHKKVMADAAQTQTQSAATERKKAYGGINWETFIKQGVYSGNSPDLAAFRRAYTSDTERYGVVRSLLNKELEALNDPEWESKNRWNGAGTREDYAAKIQDLINQMASDTWGNNIYKSAYNLGVAGLLEPLLNKSWVQAQTTGGTGGAAGTTNGQQYTIYDPTKEYEFAEGYDAKRILQAAMERWPQAKVLYDTQKKQLAFDGIDGSEEFNPYLSDYADIHKGVWYNGYYYRPDEDIPGLNMTAVRKLTPTDPFEGSVIDMSKLGEGHYLYDPESDILPSDVFPTHFKTRGDETVLLVNTTDMYTNPNGTVFRYAYDDKKSNTIQGYVDSTGRTHFGQIAKENGDVIFTDSKTQEKFNLGKINPKGKHKPFDIKIDGKKQALNLNNTKTTSRQIMVKGFADVPKAKVRYVTQNGKNITNKSDSNLILVKREDNKYFWLNPTTFSVVYEYDPVTGVTKNLTSTVQQRAAEVAKNPTVQQ
ncbi:MAG: hypothetical protein Nk1A_9010 [Endomicrobiia bacterium]|nr:MAG: hypothetical protein Nk1A_9010 [Endomicrobiia bacterium]